LINAYVEKSGDVLYYRRSAGLSAWADTALSGARGLIDIDGLIYAVVGTSVVKVTSAGVVTTLTGTIDGTDGVTLARNNRVNAGASTPDLVAVREGGGAYVISTTAVTAYPDADLPTTVNSVDFLSGFFLFTIPDGRVFASQLNSTDINALSFATAESRPDGLKRGMVHGGVFYAMGASTIEPMQNVGSTPFPLSRLTTVMPVGLLTTMAVAGFELGWDREPLFVAHDGTVRALRGYDAVKVSTPDVEAFIASSTVSTLTTWVYTTRGNAFWVLTSDVGTWEFNLESQLWNERDSASVVGWRASRSVKSNDQWVTGDRSSTSLLEISDSLRTEASAAVTWTVEGKLKEFPARIQIPGLYGDFTEAAGASISVSWSHDGGKTWSTPLTRSLDTAEKWPVCVNRLGLSTQHGLRVRYSTDTSVDFSFMGAQVPEPGVRAP
jgi:hypothetical protein